MERKTFDEMIKQIEEYQSSWRYKFDKFVFSFRSFFRFIISLPRRIKWGIQKLTRGYSDRDMWNADRYLAKKIAKVLRHLVAKSHGIPMSYYYETDEEEDVDVMQVRRDAEYIYYANIFEEYVRGSIAFNEEWKEKFGGVLESDMQEALQWFSEHFQELWD